LKNKNYTLSPKINNYQQAINYVRNVNQRNFREENFYKNPAPVKEVKLNNFPRISDYDPNTIIKFLKTRDFENLQKFIKENPNRLASVQSIGPLILMPPMRWNAVHLACKLDLVEVLKIYFNFLLDKEFMGKIFENMCKNENESHDNENENSKQTFKNTCQRLISAFLTDPDKINYEPPLHLACKYNSLECVKFLLYECYSDKNTSIVNISSKNKNGKTAEEIIGQSATASTSEVKSNPDVKSEISKKIKELFTSRNILIIQAPSETHEKLKSIPYFNKSNPPKSYIGPYSKEILTNIINKIYLKNIRNDRVTSLIKNKFLERRKLVGLDFEKGFYQFVRKICVEEGVNFVEFWPFFGGVDFLGF